MYDYFEMEKLSVGEWRRVIVISAPVMIAFFISFIIFGFWPLIVPKMLITAPNISLFPYSIPIGLAFLYFSIRYRRMDFAILSSPFLSPYFNVHSIPILLFGLLRSPKIFYAVVILLWILQAFGVVLYY